MKIKIICVVICLLQIMLLFCGCGVSKLYESVPLETQESFVPSGTVATKGDYSLEWDAERCSLAIFKKDSVVWASMPIEQ